VKPSAPVRPGRADCDKLLRAVCDALTGIAYHDDRQVCAISAERVWCDHGQESGATIDISPCPTNGKWLYQHS
jgi:Holliday junction resolvase RusA-like endonuclease